MSTTMTESIAKTLSTFTESGDFTLDDFIVFQDIDSDHITMIERYEVLRKKTSTTSAEKTEMVTLLTELEEYMPTSATWNELCACILNLEVFFRDGLVIYIKEKQAEFKAMLSQYKYVQEWSTGTSYYFGNLVSHNGYGFLNIYSNDNNDAINLNHEPNISVGFDTYWARFSIKGDKGDIGLTINYKGDYSASTTYALGDACTYNNVMYYAKSSSTGNLPTDSTYWAFVDKLYVSNIAPSDTNILWFDTSTYRLKKYNGSEWKSITIIASEISTIDSGNYFSSNTVEENLQEIGSNMIYNCIATSGTNTYTTTAIGLNSYSASPLLGICVMFANASTNASTININGLGAKNLLDSFGNTFSSSNSLKANIPYTFRYNGINFILQGKGGGGTATDPYVLSPYTYTNNNGQSTGTMNNLQGTNVYCGAEGINSLNIYASNNAYGQLKITPSPSTKPTGYCDYTTIFETHLLGLIPENVKAGVSIAGKMIGTFTSDATATSAQIVKGYKAYTNGVLYEGTATVASLGGLTKSSSGTLSGTLSSGALCIAPSNIPSCKYIVGTVTVGGYPYEFSATLGSAAGYYFSEYYNYKTSGSNWVAGSSGISSGCIVFYNAVGSSESYTITYNGYS